MRAAAPVKTFRASRNVSGFSRPMSAWDAFVYNILTMGIIFPWTYLWGPASFPGSSLEIAIAITFLAQLPISLAYCFLATVLPISGGDYIYQTRAFGRLGFIVVMSGFVIWILQWVALSGWLFATLGLAPLLLSLGTFLSLPTLCSWGLAVQTPIGIFLISILLALFTTLLLIRGLRVYVRLQHGLFAATLLAIGAVILVFVRGNVLPGLNRFVARLADLVPGAVPPELASNFASSLIRDVAASGYDLTPSFSLLATLGVVPIAWTSLQWATYSVEQNTEIGDADRFRKQVFILVISALVVALALFLIAYFERKSVGSEFMLAASAAYWAGSASEPTVGVVKTVVQPFPNVIAMYGGGSVALAVVISLGFLANAFQVTCNCFIGVTRILVAMARDRFLPRGLEVDKVDPIRHAPVRAHWLYFLAAIPWIAAYNFVPNWVTYSLGVTFACGYVFALSALAATRIPTKMRESWLASNVYRVRPSTIRLIGFLGFLSGMLMVVAYLLLPQLGLTGDVPYFIVFGVIGISYLISLFRAREADQLLAGAPEEIEQFYREPSA